MAKNAEVVAFLGMMLFAGVFWGFIEAFLFWHLDDLGASRALMGWTVAVGMVTSLPFLIFSGPITDTIGHMNVIILGMLAYTGRMLGYSFISQAAYVYPFEALEGLTMALMMTSAVTYVAKISTPTTIASVMGIFTLNSRTLFEMYSKCRISFFFSILIFSTNFCLVTLFDRKLQFFKNSSN